jgi:hypothetical protein
MKRPGNVECGASTWGVSRNSLESALSALSLFLIYKGNRQNWDEVFFLFLALHMWTLHIAPHLPNDLERPSK